MKTIRKTTLALTTLLAVACAIFLPATARSDDPVQAIHIVGGSTGAFVATPHSLTTSGYSDFAANIKCYQDGTASGEFTCAVPPYVVLAIYPKHWSQNPDGSVQIFGKEIGHDNIAHVGFEGTGKVVFRAGGKDVGGFDFKDDVFGPGQFDTEVVLFGRIEIRHNQ